MNPADLASLYIKKGHFQGGRTLDQALGRPRPGWRSRSASPRYGLPIDGFRPMEPWFALLTLQVLALQQEGYDVENGVETKLAADAEENGSRPRASRRRSSSSRSSTAFRWRSRSASCASSSRRSGSDGGDLSVLLEAWRKGDDARLEQEVFGELARDPSLAPYYELFYFDRNDRMAQSIAERVDAGGRWFVAVGAGHVVGARGIPSLLSQHGYRVRRVPKMR